VLVSVVNDHDEACTAEVYRLRENGQLERLVKGAAASISPDGSRFAYFSYRADDLLCLRSTLRVRSLTDGTETSVDTPGGASPEGNPQDWPLNWSPDGSRLTFVSTKGPELRFAAEAVVTTVGKWKTRSVDGSGVGGPSAPVFLDDDTIAAETECCIGDIDVGGFSLADGTATHLFTVPGPVRSIRRDRGGEGLWLTVEEAGLWHWDGSQVRRVVDGDVLITSG
jgi:dipeptidyl aminopeptidase/acylaminoacyl peptidase